MHIRKRKQNLSLERAVYEPAVLAADGKTVIEPARRTTKYLGSVPDDARFSQVPRELLDKLTDGEKADLAYALAVNEPLPDANLTALPGVLARAGQELVRAAAAAGQSKEAKGRLLQRWHELEAAWEGLQRDAQAAGLRRVVHRKPAKPAE